MKVRMKWRMFLPTRNHSYLRWSRYLFFIIGILSLGYAGKPRHSRIFRIASRGWISSYNPYPTATAGAFQNVNSKNSALTHPTLALSLGESLVLREISFERQSPR
jgi:hypothetical protein